MSIVKKLFVQSMIISTSILFLNGVLAVLAHFAGSDMRFEWYHPISIVLTGVLCSLPTALLQNRESWGGKTLVIRIILHCLSLYAVVTGMSLLFDWFTDIEGFIGVSAVFFIVYAFVWLSGHWLDKKDEKKINAALDAIRDDE